MYVGAGMEGRTMGNRGFSFVEMLVVFIIVGVVVAFGLPRLRDSLQKSNVRSARAGMATLVAKARAAAVSRGCTATMKFTSGTSGTVAISVCTVGGGGTEILGGVDSLAARYQVTMTSSADSLKFDARGLSVGYSGMTVRFSSNSASDSVLINPLGKVVRQ
jgi:prepilin-type N-terminal cleavage/methylation domain-containing protein